MSLRLYLDDCAYSKRLRRILLEPPNAHHVVIPADAGLSGADDPTHFMSSEWLLTKRPSLRVARAPVAKGLLAFNVLHSAGYACVAFARAGPFERDTRGMAGSIGVDERAIGALVLAPAVLDAIRYFKPEARWVTWASRAAKVASVVLVIKKK